MGAVFSNFSPCRDSVNTMMKMYPHTLMTICCVSVALIGSLLLSGCAEVQQVLDIVRPELHVKDVKVTGLTFEGVNLAVALEASNLNPLPISLTGFDYELKINESSFLKGQEEETFTIAAMESTVFQIPVSLNFQDLYSTFQTLRNQDMTSYKIDGGVSFELPALGVTRIPFGTDGEFPALKMPTVNVDGLRVKKLDFEGADMELKLNITNPNGFDLLLNSLNYNLAVGGKTWAAGSGQQAATIKEKGKSSIRIPMSLDFAQIGLSASQLFAKGKNLDYQLSGKLDLGSSLPLLQHATFPLDYSGQLNISR